MAIYHLHVNTGSRQGGQSASAKADYIQRQGKYDRGDDEVAHTESGHMPKWAADEPNDYWQAADAGERANGRLFREVEFALPHELDEGQQVELAREFAQEITQEEHLPYTLAIHRGESQDPGKADNPHCHLMISERSNDGIERSAETWFKRYNAAAPEKGGARKSTATKPKEWLEDTREAWGKRANQALERAGRDERIHEGTLEQQYWDAVEGGNEHEAARLENREPGVHLGPVVHMEEQRGIATERGSLHAEIAECNAIAAQIADYRYAEIAERNRARVDERSRQGLGEQERSQKAERAALAAAEQLIPVSEEERAVGQIVGQAVGKRRVQAKRVVELTKESPKIERRAEQRGGVKRREFADGRTYREATGVSLKRLHERQAWEQTKPLRDEQRADLGQQHRQQRIKLYERQEGEIAWLDKHSRTEAGRKELAEEAAKLKKVHGEELGPDDVLQNRKKELEEVHRGRRAELGRQQGQELETLGKQQQIDYQNALREPLRKETLMKAMMAVEADIRRQAKAIGVDWDSESRRGDYDLKSITQEYGIEIERSWERERERQRIGPSL